MLAGLTTSEINERAVYHAITARPYRRMVDKLVTQLDAGRERAMASLRDVGMTLLARPRGGMFVSAGWHDAPSPAWNGQVIADLALKHSILLSPCDFFVQNAPQAIWFRFNVAYADHPQLLNFLRLICRQ
jgi:DNA-binding transcriptional MocR family regulator